MQTHHTINPFGPLPGICRDAVQQTIGAAMGDARMHSSGIGRMTISVEQASDLYITIHTTRNGSAITAISVEGDLSRFTSSESVTFWTGAAAQIATRVMGSPMRVKSSHASRIEASDQASIFMKIEPVPADGLCAACIATFLLAPLCDPAPAGTVCTNCKRLID